MIESKANLWNPDFENGIRVITTNGFIKKDGTCVMGRGCAQEAKNKYLGLDLRIGKRIQEEGNHVFLFEDLRLATFPTKHVWWEDSDLLLIQRSAQELVELVSKNFPVITKIYIPRPGCGNGGLTWEEVKPVLEPIFTTEQYVIVKLY